MICIMYFIYFRLIYNRNELEIFYPEIQVAQVGFKFQLSVCPLMLFTNNTHIFEVWYEGSCIMLNELRDVVMWFNL